MAEQPEKNAGVIRSKAGHARTGTVRNSLLLVFAGAAITFVFFYSFAPRSGQPRRLWTPVVVETNGNITILGETRQMEFWTPSARTKDYLPKNNGVIRNKEGWQIIPSDDVVLQFGVVLHSNTDVLGYRRVEVWGHGRTTYKPGWWWTMNVTTNYTVSELAHTYQEFWKTPQMIFIEVIDNRGRDE